MEKRIKKALSFIKDKGAEAAIANKAEDIYYLSNFFPTSACFLIIDQEQKHRLIVSEMEKSTAEEACKDFDSGFEIYSFSSMKELKGILKGIFERMLKKRKVAIDKESISLSLYEKLIKRKIPAKSIVNASFSELRAVKEEEEIGRIKNAVNISGKVFDEIKEKLAGKREREIVNEISFLIGSYERSEIAFKPIVASEKNSRFPHHESGERVIKKGEIVVIDFGAKYERYACDITRTIFLSNKEKYIKAYEAVREAQKEAIKLLKPGENVKKIDARAREIFREHGIEDCIKHAFGHGIGLEVHEFPRISRHENAFLKKNMVIAIEPGAYFNDFGIRIEDVVIVKDNPEIITKSIY